MCLAFIDIPSSDIGSSAIEKFRLTYHLFGKPLGTAPVVLVNHALTGNSKAAGKNGWWNRLIGDYLTIDTKIYTVIAFDIPGNGYDGDVGFLIEDYRSVTTRCIAQLFWKGLEKLDITQLFAVVGGSLGGAVAWEMAFLKPDAISVLIPIACHYRASDWLIGNVLVQDAILNYSAHPIEHARMHAMLLYRTPLSLEEKFGTAFNKEEQHYQVESWLKYHGKALHNRFHLASYKLMNHLLKTIGEHITPADLEHFARQTTVKLHLIAIDSDCMFTEREQFETYRRLKKHYKNIQFSSIKSIHGHDGFLIEFSQLHNFIHQHFNKHSNENIKIRR